MDLKPVLHDLLGCIDLKKAEKILVEDLVLAALKKVVDDSTNKFDDAAYAMLVPLLVPQLEALINAKIDAAVA
jgi:hypothetical protein